MIPGEKELRRRNIELKAKPSHRKLEAENVN